MWMSREIASWWVGVAAAAESAMVRGGDCGYDVRIWSMVPARRFLPAKSGVRFLF